MLAATPAAPVKLAVRHADGDPVRIAIATVAVFLLGLMSPAGAMAACQHPVWDAATSTYTLDIPDQEGLDRAYVSASATQSSTGDWSTVHAGTCEPMGGGERFSGVTINASRDFTLRVDGSSALDGAAVIVNRLSGSMNLELHHGIDGENLTTPLRLRIRDDGLDVNEDGVTDIVLNAGHLGSLKIHGAYAADRIDLRGLAIRPWGRFTKVIYTGGTNGADRRMIWAHDTELSVVAAWVQWPLTVISTGTKAVNVEAGRGADLISLGAGNDDVSSGAGNDIVRLGAGNDWFGGGDSSGFVKPGDILNRRVSIYGGPGNDHIGFGADRSRADGGHGRDRIEIRGTANTIIAGSGNDYIKTAKGPNFVDAGIGNDALWLYMTATMERFARTNCGIGGDTINFARRGMRSCERVLVR